MATGMEPGSTCTVERASNLSTPFVDVSSEVVKQNIVEPSELTRIEGVGAARIEKYGSDLLSVVGTH